MINLEKYSSGIQHLGLPTTDIDTTINFYKSLGFEIALQTINPHSNQQVAFLRFGNLTIETYGNFPETAMQPGAWDHIAIDVKNVDALFDEIKTAGYNLLDTEVQSIPFWDNGIRYFRILGPNAETIEFCEIL